MIGLKRGAVKLCAHEKEWESEARDTILRLRRILGPVIRDIQHVGSTSIASIKAKPILDIAIAVDRFEDVLAQEEELRREGFHYRPQKQASSRNQLLLACGSFYEGTGDLQTHFIHVVLTGSMDWINYVNFRDYLNKKPSVAKEYERLKLSLAQGIPADGDRKAYTDGKQEFIAHTLRKALVDSYLGKTVHIEIDRPVHSAHPRHPELIYPVNYGYVPHVLGGDGRELDVYLLGVDFPVKEFTARIIGIVHRADDMEDKLVSAPEGLSFTEEELAAAVYFQEQYFQHQIEVFSERPSLT